MADATAADEYGNPAFPTHPQYQKLQGTWHMLRDCFEGEAAVKAKRTLYLPPTPGQILDGMPYAQTCNKGKICNEANPGYLSYLNYIRRAQFPDFYTEGVKTLVGILNEKPPKITVPEGMEDVLLHVTKDRESAETLLRKMHFECLKTGRGGLLVDMPKTAASEPMPYIALYEALQIINWDDGSFNDGDNIVNMVVLDESGVKRTQSFTWDYQHKFRVLVLAGLDPAAPLDAKPVYQQYEVESEDGMDQTPAIVPKAFDMPLDRIPFTFFGPVDLDPSPDQPPLLGLGRLCMHIYSSEADYRYTLFMQGQDTLVVIGEITQHNKELPAGGGDNEPIRVGADAHLTLPTGGDAKYIGVDSKGLPEMRAALNSDKELAAVRTGQLLAPGKMSMESGEALKTRVAAQTATLSSVAISCAAALEDALRNVARLKNLDPSKVKVEPNLEFSNYQIATQDLVQLITAKRLGYPVSMVTLHEVAKERGITRMTFEQEIEAIKKDPEELTAIMQSAGTAAGNNPVNAAGGPGAKLPEAKAPSNAQS